MVQRRVIPVGDERRILLTTERLADASWAVVASIVESTPNGERVVDLPVSDERFPSQATAEAAGEHQAREWIEHNVAKAA
jgi:hypothetical protein